MIRVHFSHTGPRSNQLMDIAEKHRVKATGGHASDRGGPHPYAISFNGNKVDEQFFLAQVRTLPYVTFTEIE